MLIAVCIVVAVIGLLSVLVFGGRYTNRAINRIIEKGDEMDLKSRRRDGYWVLNKVDYKTEEAFLKARHLHDVQLKEKLKRKLHGS